MVGRRKDTSQKHKTHSTYKRKDALSGIAVVGAELKKVLLILEKFSYRNKEKFHSHCQTVNR